MKKTLYILVFIFYLGFLENVLAWDNEKTHRDISGFAGNNSVLSIGKGDYLKTLGFTEGLNQRFKWGNAEKTAKEWLQDGAFLEDEGSYWDAVTGKARYTNHFHNPLKPWSAAGLSDLQSGESSLLWAQDSARQSVSLGGDWSWQKIRLCYYNALTVQTADNRQAFFACTFEGLGYQMHLIQDASQPAHVRNDAHPADGMGGVLGMMEGLETWAKKNPTQINSFASPPVFPLVSLAISYGGYVPITQFIDTNQYYGENPSSSSGLGLSEYTNANFVSDDTIFTEDKGINHKHYFPYPRYSTNSYEMYEVEHSLITKRIYLRKKGDGEGIEHFATAGPLFKFLSFNPVLQKSELKLDPVVYKDYAALLIPRAVGYSAGLLNYFFRGNIGIERDQNAPDELVVMNLSPENMNGMFGLYYDDAGGNRLSVKGWGLLDIPAYSPEYVPLSYCSLNKLKPEPKEKGKYILVFQGIMGNETGAVAGNANINLLSSSCENSLTIKGSDTISQDSSEQFEVTGCTGCEDDINWEITGEGANIDKTGFLAVDKTACGGTVIITAKCPVCETETTKTITIPDAITISAPDSSNCYTASGGAGSYTWDISKGSIDSNGCVTTTTGQCGITTVTITDANGCKTTTTVTLPDTLTITGPEAPVDGSCYMTTGGTAPYTWDITKGTIDENGCVDLTGQCGPATVKAKDVNECTGKKEVNIPAVPLDISGADMIAKNSSETYSASGCSKAVSWSVVGKGATIEPLENAGALLKTDETACREITITAKCPDCNTEASKNVSVSDTCGTLTISGSDTTVKSSTRQYTMNGCCGEQKWSVSGAGASISSAGFLTTTSSACGSLLVTATCEGCGTSATQEVRVTDAGTWFLQSQQLNINGSICGYDVNSNASCIKIEGDTRTIYGWMDYHSWGGGCYQGHWIGCWMDSSMSVNPCTLVAFSPAPGCAPLVPPINGWYYFLHAYVLDEVYIYKWRCP